MCVRAHVQGVDNISKRHIKRRKKDEEGKNENIQSPFPTGAFASAGPDCHPSIFVEAIKIWSLRGAPGFEISLTSLRVTPVVSPSPLVERTTPS